MNVKNEAIIKFVHQCETSEYCFTSEGPGAVVEAACLKSPRSRVRTPLWSFQRNKLFLPHSLVNIQYCWEPPWPRGSVLGLRPPGLEFRILCLERSVIPFISPSSGGSPGPKHSFYIIYLAFWAIMAISPQKEARSRDYTVFLLNDFKGFFIVQNTIDSSANSRLLSSLEYCMCTASTTKIRSGWNWNPVPPYILSHNRYKWFNANVNVRLMTEVLILYNII